MRSGVELFLSEEAIELHKEYLRTLKYRYSILEKSFPEINGLALQLIAKIRHNYKDETLSLKTEILCHELFFNSFGSSYQSSLAVKKWYGSEAAFLYEVFNICKSSSAPFLIINKERGRVNVNLIKETTQLLKIAKPLLAIDLCEHAYFLDYGFDREGYLNNLLPRINLAILDNF